MSKLEIAKGVYWVGAVDWNVRHFHGHTYETNRGTTYNSYLIVDEKIALIDGVYGPFYQEWLDRIKEIVDPKKIDYMVVNHVETDHSGSVPIMMEINPRAKVICSAKCKEGLLKHYYQNWDFQIVKTSETLKLGQKTLRFIEAPMIHWPDSMFTYIDEQALLLPNDAFGQHLATSQRFDDEVDNHIIMEEAARYYANILWPLSPIILKKLEELLAAKIKINMIAPSHGIIWRKNPGQIIEAYLKWAKGIVKDKVVIAYETMWGATEKMARVIGQKITDAGFEVKIFSVPTSSRSDVITEMLDAKAILIGSSTHDNGMLPNLAGFLDFLKGLKPKGRVAAAFGSYGWAGGAVAAITGVLKEAGCEVFEPGLQVKYTPSEEDIKSCEKFAEDILSKIKNK
jgi:anaerobic nitric oxide reductase flavorubredoxin